VANVGDLIFDAPDKKTKQPKEDSITKALDSWVNRPSSNPASGLARGLISFGTQTVRGVTGIVSEPIKGAMEDGGKGFAIGVVKGLTGVVTRPIAGLIEFGAKTTEGFVSTPLSIAEGLRVRGDQQEVKIPLYFGRPLEESFKWALDNDRSHITELAIEYLLEYGTEIEGIFRISGSTITLQNWKQEFDDGVIIRFDETVWAHDVCAIFKLYLRELPEGLVPASSWLPLFDSSQDDSALDEKAVYDMLMNLPPFNKLVLFKIFHLLDQIIANEVITKMTVSNLAVCLSPCILRSPDSLANVMNLELIQKSQKVFIKLINSWRSISERRQRGGSPIRKFKSVPEPSVTLKRTLSQPSLIISIKEEDNTQPASARELTFSNPINRTLNLEQNLLESYIPTPSGNPITIVTPDSTINK